MAFNWSTFRTRAGTAIIFAAVMLAGLLWNRWSFWLLFSVIHFGCWWEYLRLTEKIHSTRFHSYVKLGLMLIGYGILLLFCHPAYQWQGYGLASSLSLPVSTAGFVLLVMGLFQRGVVSTRDLLRASLGLLYISVSLGLMIFLYDLLVRVKIGGTSQLLTGVFFPVVIIASIWINDTMAYIVGSLIGKYPLSSISPKKTWEGTIGGILLCTMVIYFGSYFYFHACSSLLLFIATIAGVAGTFGDLLESKLKRMAQVKDSGRIMPGHGGFLDRFDSLLLAVPFVWLLLFILSRS